MILKNGKSTEEDAKITKDFAHKFVSFVEGACQ